MSEPCPHDCATGIGTITTVTPEWAGTIWECTECHAIGEDAADTTAIMWTDHGDFTDPRSRRSALRNPEDECVYCTPHLTSQHDCTGCLVEGCPCGYDGDWHPDPPRGDE